MTTMPAATQMRRSLNVSGERAVPMIIAIGYLLLVAQLFIQHTRFFDVTLTGFRIPAVIFACFFVALLVSGGLMAAIQTTSGRLWLVFLLWALLSALFGIWRSNSVAKILPSFQALVLFCGIVTFTVNSRLLARNLKLIGFFAITSALLGLFVVGGFGERLSYLQGVFADANEFSIWLMLGLPAIWLAAAQSKNFGMKLIYFGAGAPIFWAMLKTGSRGSLMGLGVLFLAAFITTSPLKKVGVLILCLLGSGAFFFLPDNLKERYTTIVSDSSNMSAESAERLMEAIESRNIRLEIFWKSIEVTLSHPLLGVGADNFGTHISDLEKKAKGRNTPSFTTHNTYTQLSSETGIPGLLLFLAILAVGLRNLNWILRTRSPLNEGISDRTRDCAYYLRLSLIGVAAGSFFLSLSYSALYYILTGLITACANIANTEVRDYRFARQSGPRLAANAPATPQMEILEPAMEAIARNPIKFGRSRPLR